MQVIERTCRCGTETFELSDDRCMLLVQITDLYPETFCIVGLGRPRSAADRVRREPHFQPAADGVDEGV